MSIAKDIGGRASPGSGNTRFEKSDAYSEDFRIEDKFTDKLKYSIQFNTLSKIEKESVNTNKIPILRFGFLKGNENYAMIRKIDCNNIVDTILYETNNKSISFLRKDLLFLFLNSKNIILCEINFKKYNKIYYITKWESFIENKKIFLS